jgi:4-amino-4-deoxy-L-arabinose transferase-like glycosyltransferase
LRPPIVIAAAFLLAALGLFLVYDHTREDSLSADEPIHILSGYFAVASRSAIVNIEHPPLIKILSGLAVTRLALRPPPAKVPMGNVFVTSSPAFFFGNSVPADTIIAAARAPQLAVFAGLLFLVFAAAWRRYGPGAALLAVSLLAFDPNLLAHAGVVHTDMGATLVFPAMVLAWNALEKRPGVSRLCLAAVVLGLSLATKFSAVYLLPILAVQTLLRSRRAERPGRAAAAGLARLAAAAGGALLVVTAIYAPVTAGMDLDDQKTVIREKVGLLGNAPVLAERIASLANLSRPLAHYAGGLASVMRQNSVGGGITYLNGRISTRGFPEYFFVAYAAKSTLAFLAATLAIAAALIRRSGSLAEEIRLFLVPVAVLFLASVGTTYNIGIRHLLPIYPFLALFAAALFASAWEKRRRSSGARAAVAAWILLPLVSAVELARIHPHELSYFNPLVGGPEAGARILSDSNIDWGLDLKRLAAELKRRGVTDPTVSYFGGDNVLYRIGVPDFSAQPVLRGRLVAISVFFLTAGPEFYAYHGAEPLARALAGFKSEILSAGRPAGRIGHSIALFELPAGGR